MSFLNPRKWNIIGKLRILMTSFILVMIVGAMIIGFRWFTSGDNVDVATIVFKEALADEPATITARTAELISELSLESVSITVSESEVNVSDSADAMGAEVKYEPITNVIEIQAKSISDDQYVEITTILTDEYGELVKTLDEKYSKKMTNLSDVSIPGQPFNWGLDFTGGTIIDITFEESFTLEGKAMDDSAVISEVRAMFSKHGVSVGSIQVQRKTGAAEADVKIANSLLIRTQESSQTKLQTVIDDLRERFGEDIKEQQRIDTIGPVIGNELKSTAWKALLWALSIIFVYIAFRFQPNASVAAIACLVHDLFFVLGIFSLFWVEVNLAAVAALLAMISYDVQDTVVIMDRVRENTKLWLGRISYPDMINMSVTQTFMRSFNTSVTTLFAILVLLFFGGRTILDFTLILFLGLLAGTFSSIYIAAPLLVVWRNAGIRYAGGEQEQMSLASEVETKKNGMSLETEPETKQTDSVSKPSTSVKKGPPTKKRKPGRRKKRK
jgi:preprotein translocase subunit SecF